MTKLTHDTLIGKLRRFHADEGGMEALQTVVILAIASLVMLMLAKYTGKAGDEGSDTIGGWVNTQLKAVFNIDFVSGGSGEGSAGGGSP